MRGLTNRHEIFRDNGRAVTTVGTVLHTGRLERGGHPEIVFVEKTDANWFVRSGDIVEGSRQRVSDPETLVQLPAWVIPSGHVEQSDNSLEAAAAREVREEVGITVPKENLRRLDYFDPTAFETHPEDYIPTKGALIFSCNIRRQDILDLGQTSDIEGITIITPKPVATNTETGRIALIPNWKLYSDHPIVTLNYKWEYAKLLKLLFELKRII